MVDLRKVYAAQPGQPGAKVTTHWKPAQQLSVSADTPLGWNQYTCHLTVETWDTAGQEKRIRKFHFSFKKWKGAPVKPQPGCTWLWTATQSKFAFQGWYQVPALYLKPGENVIVATKVNEFVRRNAELLVLDKQMWAALGDATPAA